MTSPYILTMSCPERLRGSSKQLNTGSICTRTQKRKDRREQKRAGNRERQKAGFPPTETRNTYLEFHPTTRQKATNSSTLLNANPASASPLLHYRMRNNFRRNWRLPFREVWRIRKEVIRLSAYVHPLLIQRCLIKTRMNHVLHSSRSPVMRTQAPLRVPLRSLPHVLGQDIPRHDPLLHNLPRNLPQPLQAIRLQERRAHLLTAGLMREPASFASTRRETWYSNHVATSSPVNPVLDRSEVRAPAIASAAPSARVRLWSASSSLSRNGVLHSNWR